MGREVRRVPADWQHPKHAVPDYRAGLLVERYKPLLGGSWAQAAREWDAEREKWERGEFPDYASEESRALPYDQWNGRRPYSEDYMPDWPAEQRTHLMMYEDTSEGTPISPAFATPEELARWLVDNNASAFGSSTGTYEGWLRVARGGWAPSMVATAEGITSGVDFAAESQAPAPAHGRMPAGSARALIARLTAAVRGDDGDEIEAAMTAVSDALQRPWEARFAPAAVRQLMDTFNGEGWRKESDDTDALLKHLGLEPETCRTHGGWLNLPRIKSLLGQCCEKAAGPGRVCADCAAASRAYSADMAPVRATAHTPCDEHLMNFLAPWVIADDPKDRADFLAALRAALALQAPAVGAEEPTVFGAGDIVRIRDTALAVFHGCGQEAHDVIEWYHSSLLGEVL